MSINDVSCRSHPRTGSVQTSPSSTPVAGRRGRLEKWKLNTHTHKIEWIDKTLRQMVEATSKETQTHKEKREQKELKNKIKIGIKKENSNQDNK